MIVWRKRSLFPSTLPDHRLDQSDLLWVGFSVLFVISKVHLSVRITDTNHHLSELFGLNWYWVLFCWRLDEHRFLIRVDVSYIETRSQGETSKSSSIDVSLHYIHECDLFRGRERKRERDSHSRSVALDWFPFRIQTVGDPTQYENDCIVFIFTIFIYIFIFISCAHFYSSCISSFSIVNLVTVDLRPVFVF